MRLARVIGVIALFSLISCHNDQKLFTNLDPKTTGVSFTNTLPEKPGLGILSYIYYYNGGGVAIGDINQDGLPDLYFASNTPGQNKLYLNKGHFQFEDITAKAGVAGTSDWSTGVTMADVNGDGLLDIYVCAIANVHALQGHNELFINQGGGKFKESSAEYGLNYAGMSTQAVFFDYDHDGDLDCFILNQSEHPNQNIINSSNRTTIDQGAGEKLYRNDPVNGTPHFTDVTAKAGLYQSKLNYGLGIAVGDLNNDGWDDIYVGNDFHENDYYYINNGNGTFTESGASHFRHYSRYSMGNDIADYNNDGQPDIFTADMLPGDEKTLKTYGNGEHYDTYIKKITSNGYQDQYSKNCLQRNNGGGTTFSDVGLISGVASTDWSWSPLFADFDNDGYKDLFISSGIVKRPLDLDFIMYLSSVTNPQSFGTPDEFQKAMVAKMPDGASHPFLFKGYGDAGFKDVSTDWGTGNMKGYYNGAAIADLNNDGNQDVVINCLNSPAVILRNNSPKKNTLSIAFKGAGMNTSGIGAKAYLFSGGKIQYQELMLTRGFMSSSEPRLHFGLGTLSFVDSVLIVWPTQKCELLKKVKSNQRLSFDQENAKVNFKYAAYFKAKPPILEDVSSVVLAGYKHEENSFTDFNIQYLIPHFESTRGPKLAVADVNKDGLDDVFITGAKGQAGCLLIQNAKGKFQRSDTALFAGGKQSEGVAAVFFDANNDSYPDLYVVSGGYEYEDGNPSLRDHLYMNDGKGHFHESPASIPSILKNKSCVASADVNHDGYPDLFIGGLAVSDKFGMSKTQSYLLLNDGKGNFKLASTPVISLSESGVVTSAAFTDLNNDGWPDLVVAGEWMGIQVFINHKGHFTKTELGGSKGMWQSVLLTDVNGDGFPDILVGNWGLNSKLAAGKDDSLKLYVKDFNNTGSCEQIMTYFIKGEEYPFLGKDELETAIPALKRRNLYYSDVAGKSVQYIFGDLLNNCTELKIETLASACFYGDGKGSFTKKDLPRELQLAPIFSFSAGTDPRNPLILAAGNFYGVLPFEGRYDALNPSFISYDRKSRKFGRVSQIPGSYGECRDAKWITCAGGKKMLVLARNNAELAFFKPVI